MFRPTPVVLAAVALVCSSCGLVSDPDVAARVDDEELTIDALTELVSDTDPAVTSAAVTRARLTEWIDERLPTEANPELAPELYPQGLATSGTSCARALVTDVADDRDAAEDELADGEPWADVHGRYNLDPNLNPADGFLGCLPFEAYNPGDLVTDLIAGLDATQTFASGAIENGPTALYIVLGFVPYDELEPDSVALVVSQLPPDTSSIDIEVNPRFGFYDPLAGVVPLG